jgi:hypothetical protein
LFGSRSEEWDIQTMKLALAIICSFLLAGTPLLVAQPTAKSACAQQVRSCCKGGAAMPCCQAKPSSDSQRAPVTPAPATGQSQLSLLAPAVLIWTLPENPANLIDSKYTPFPTVSGAPLFARNCARLL